jgi:hypothetical protein
VPSLVVLECMASNGMQGLQCFPADWTGLACVLAAAAVAADIDLLQGDDVSVASLQLRDHRRQLVAALDVPLQGQASQFAA